MTQEIELKMVNEYGDPSLLVTIGGESAALATDELEQLIETLGLFRADLAPAPDETVSTSDRFAVEWNVEWRLHYNPLFDGALLFLRHTGFGWTGFGLPFAEMDLFMNATMPPSEREISDTRNQTDTSRDVQA